MEYISNFDFLKKHQDWLFKLAESAELNFSSDPNTTLIKIRQLGEAIAQTIAARIGVESGVNIKQIDLLKDLDYNLRLDDNVRGAFHTIRKLGNTATHQFDSTSHRDALKANIVGHALAMWFHITFGSESAKGFMIKTFVKFQNPSEYVSQPEAKSTIPAIQAQLEFIQYIQKHKLWQYITGVYESPTMDLVHYRKKIEMYIKDHQDQLTIQKLKRNMPITQSDLDVLDGLLLEASGMSDIDAYHGQILQEKPLGTFIRQLVGLDINAAKEAFSHFLDAGIYNSDQINFVNQVIDYLAHNGIFDMAHIFEPPFTDNHGESAYGFFDEGTVVELFGAIRKVNANAVVEEDKSA